MQKENISGLLAIKSGTTLKHSLKNLSQQYLLENQLPGTVIFFGCPGEEGGSGKTFMARAGVFDDVDCALAWHPGAINGTDLNSSTANYQVIYRFHGISAHAGIVPQNGRSALDALELMNTGGTIPP